MTEISEANIREAAKFFAKNPKLASILTWALAISIVLLAIGSAVGLGGAVYAGISHWVDSNYPGCQLSIGDRNGIL